MIDPFVTLDRNILREVGLGALSLSAGNRVLDVAYDTVVGGFSARLMNALTDAEQAEYDQYFYAGDQTGARRFIAEKVPAYMALLAIELAEIKARLQRDASAILAIETALDDCATYYDRQFADLDDAEIV